MTLECFYNLHKGSDDRYCLLKHNPPPDHCLPLEGLILRQNYNIQVAITAHS